MLGRWLAIGILGFTVGAATIVLADSGDDAGRIAAAASPGGAGAAVNASAEGSGGSVVHDHTGDVVTGVKALDIRAEAQPDVPLDRVTREQLALQLAGAREVALRYPTVADATAAGMRVAGGFAPGSGAHYISYSGISGEGPIDVEKVNSFIYEGTNPESRIVGLMYYSNSNAEGFAGPNDHWHRHSNVCVKFAGATGIEVPFPADADVGREECEAAGARLMPITGWMVHAWVVPGWESPQGVFSHENLNIRCADGTYDTDKAGFCQGT
ncbi:MAG: hypothetical protein WEC34_12885 [Acidimicrobiia bacterium]